MAMESPLILSSILAFAAKYMSAMAKFALIDELSRKVSGYSWVFGNRALDLLTQELQILTSTGRTDSSVRPVGGYTRRRYDTLLVAILVLYNVETVRPGM